jgi:hypothetical protein
VEVHLFLGKKAEAVMDRHLLRQLLLEQLTLVEEVGDLLMQVHPKVTVVQVDLA